MSRMPILPRPAFRWAWLAVAVLLLKAAVPLLASAAAGLQDKALVEICTGYGVATVALDTPGPDAPPQEASPHADACALPSLLAFAAPGTAPAVPNRQASEAAPLRVADAPRPCDACARWAAGLRHGPPAYA